MFSSSRLMALPAAGPPGRFGAPGMAAPAAVLAPFVPALASFYASVLFDYLAAYLSFFS